jgi:hypothetical protein
MAAGMDCVAITDHNSGDWIDPLQAAYRQMEQEARTIPIPAHADRSAPSGKALFAIREGSQASIVDATTLKQLFAARLLACSPARLLACSPARLLACSPWSGRTSIALFRQRQALARRWARLGREV